MITILTHLFASHKESSSDTKFSKFFREASSAERKKVFLNVAKKATLDQQKVMQISK
ncbi:MAG: hypothetical protein RLZZ308_387 [Candidatus Parcubacteria bacterium]|jgi:hypothetical protein